ncbi:unnamed protein product (macronuclear) [Paramecium tetraurelia]|uniref:Uncharacterized protein n=2 Tax=Paramecium TaxID=5884 RepID=A0EF96_PARTE|nr:uncharacterized protein GSPATT00026310001 [Paramecium tetraurelia]CAD8201788.1 unnamed protein product [Paramecium octaurelia]CAK93987.1 unnamed protein product [Paramecium tetraurelia]|eukprot:XP_001461360.1 hypothetical protein (macronuclear) [Paramecium tetraurelia strain d4-2]
MGVCTSKKHHYPLQRSQPQRNIEIDFVKLLEYNRKKEVKDNQNNQQQQSFCQIFLQENKNSNHQTFTQNLAPTAQLDYKKI